MPIYLRRENNPEEIIPADEVTLQRLEGIAWLDLVRPSAEEIAALSRALGLDLPTREDMREIESTSRLYYEDGARFMTTSLIVGVGREEPLMTDIAFILARDRLITVREEEPTSFQKIILQVGKGSIVAKRDTIFLAILEAIVDRQADLLEKLSHDIEALSRLIYTRMPKAKESEQNLRRAIYELGRSGDLIGRQRDSLTALGRLVQFVGHEDFDGDGPDAAPVAIVPRLKPVSRDLQSLSEFASFLTTRINFMLDATLGLIQIEQSSIVKIFTVAAVIFLPPTLVASVYGMNFQYMPELDERWGYPLALGLMVTSVIIPLLYCRRRGWL